MALTDMKRPKPKKEDAVQGLMPAEVGYDRYPYGLRLTLDTQELEKLGLKASDFKVGQSITINAQGSITSISSYETTGKNGDSQNVGIQIEKLDLGMKSAKFAGWKAEKGKGPTE